MHDPVPEPLEDRAERAVALHEVRHLIEEQRHRVLPGLVQHGVEEAVPRLGIHGSSTAGLKALRKLLSLCGGTLPCRRVIGVDVALVGLLSEVLQ